MRTDELIIVYLTFIVLSAAPYVYNPARGGTWNTRVHPKRKLQSLDEEDKSNLFNSVKTTMRAMWKESGRDTERDLFGEKGGYKTILSANTLKSACPVCGGTIVREAYMGGNIYLCPNCQPWDLK